MFLHKKAMHRLNRLVRLLVPALAGVAVLGGCSDRHPMAAARDTPAAPAGPVLQAFDCTGTVAGAGAVSCTPATSGNARGAIIGGQGRNVRLTSSNVSYDTATQTLQFDVTVQNLFKEAIGTPDGVVPDSNGIRVFFNFAPKTTVGTGTVTVANPDGIGIFTSSGQPYFTYPHILKQNQVSPSRTWKLSVPLSVTTFTFQLFVATEVQFLMVINEVMANPGAGKKEWFELYNAGSGWVTIADLLIADSAAGGWQPYTRVVQYSQVAPGYYVVLDNTPPIRGSGYGYGSALDLSETADAIRIARAYGADTLIIDQVSYANGAISAKTGTSRELKNPAYDNANVDGPNWADMVAGTPWYRNLSYVP